MVLLNFSAFIRNLFTSFSSIPRRLIALDTNGRGKPMAFNCRAKFFSLVDNAEVWSGRNEGGVPDLEGKLHGGMVGSGFVGEVLRS